MPSERTSALDSLRCPGCGTVSRHQPDGQECRATREQMVRQAMRVRMAERLGISEKESALRRMID